jgi:hypothetical protein
MTPTGKRVWTAHPEAELFVRSLLERAFDGCAEAHVFQLRLLDACAIRLRDILDHIAVPPDVGGYEEAGWKQIEIGVWRHFGGSFPDVLERNHLGVGFKVESVDQLTRALGIDAPVEGAPHGPFRRVRVFSGAGAYFDAVERHGWAGVDAPLIGARRIARARLHQQIFRTRPRPFRRASLALSMTKRLATAAIADLGKHWACALFMQAEREYWSQKSNAGALQRRRQDKFGVGWCNIDHYTYACSREHFDATVSLLERLGYERRELLYAGARAGWGAMVLEQPALRSAVLVKMDMTPEDLIRGGVPGSLSPLTVHNRVGVWTALHGESMLEGGLSYAAGLYDCQGLQDYLSREDVAMSASPRDDARLHQTRTRGERRAVDPKRVDALERSGHLAGAEADDLRFNGAEAAQLEGLQRSDGFKGFRQTVAGDTLKPLDHRRNESVAKAPSRRRQSSAQPNGRSRASKSLPR